MNEAAEFDGRQKTAKVPHLAGVYCESFGTKNEVHVSEAFAFIYVVLPNLPVIGQYAFAKKTPRPSHSAAMTSWFRHFSSAAIRSKLPLEERLPRERECLNPEARS